MAWVKLLNSDKPKQYHCSRKYTFHGTVLPQVQGKISFHTVQNADIRAHNVDIDAWNVHQTSPNPSTCDVKGIFFLPANRRTFLSGKKKSMHFLFTWERFRCLFKPNNNVISSLSVIISTYDYLKIYCSFYQPCHPLNSTQWSDCTITLLVQKLLSLEQSTPVRIFFFNCQFFYLGETNWLIWIIIPHEAAFHADSVVCLVNRQLTFT